MMKSNFYYLSLLFVLALCITSQAQNTYVPDDKFEQYLINQGYDDVMDDSISTSSVDTITILNLRMKGILDLTGINDFIALKELDISDNLGQIGRLSNVDITGLINIEKLDASDNEIDSIDLSFNTKLIDLNLQNNKLTSLDINALTDLEYLNVGRNEIANINFSNNTKLTSIEININKLDSTLDLSQQPELYKLNANENNIDSVIFNDNCKINLTELSLSMNKLRSLNVVDFENLFYLYLSHNELTSVEFGNNKDLYQCTLHHNNLATLDFNVQRAGSNILLFDCSYNELTSLSVSSSIGSIESFKCNNNQLPSFVINGVDIEEFDISDNPGAQISYANSGSIDDLRINNNNLTSIGVDPSTLHSLWCSNNNLTSLDNIDHLYDLDCSYNEIATLDITAEGGISTLICNNNKLTSLGVLPKKLSALHCENNELTSLNLDSINQYYFTTLVCDSNNIDSLNLEQLRNLSYISCSHNNLTKLNLTHQGYGNPIKDLYCNDNKLTELDLRNIYIDEMSYPRPLVTTNNPDLTCIYVTNKEHYEVFTEIDVHSHYVLDEDECGSWTTWVSIPDSRFENELISQEIDDIADGRVLKQNIVNITDLTIKGLKIQDLSGIEEFINLTELDFSSNYVSSIDLSHNPELRVLICSMNPVLDSINITNNPEIWHLNCGATSISQLDLSQNSKLKYLDCNDTEITTLDLINNALMKGLKADNCKLISLDLRNLDIDDVESISTTNNPDLTCIYVDDALAFKNKFTEIDPTTSFVANESECNPLSIENTNESIQIGIFPNPTRDYFKVDSAIGVNKVTVYNVIGEVVKTYSNQSSYNTSSLKAGSYIVHIETDKGNSVTKLIKQ